METYYLIDYENVHEDGLSGGEDLTKNDYVQLFFTKNASKISIEKIACMSRANLALHEIPVGSQSLDMHLVSYLGYLIGTKNDKKCRFIIISKDTDYDNIIHFWKELKNVSVTRQSKILISGKPVKQDKVRAINTEKKSTDSKRELNNEIQKTLSKANYTNDIISFVASLACKHLQDKYPKQTIYRSIISKYGQEKGLSIYNHIKKYV